MKRGRVVGAAIALSDSSQGPRPQGVTLAYQNKQQVTQHGNGSSL